MNKLKSLAISGTAAMLIGGAITWGAAACTPDPDYQADVLQYGYYSPTHVWIAYPQPVLVHVSYRVYHSDSRMYSSPSYEKTYVKTHTVTRQTVTTNRSSGVLNNTPQDKIPPGYSPKAPTVTSAQRSTITRSVTTTKGR